MLPDGYRHRAGDFTGPSGAASAGHLQAVEVLGGAIAARPRGGHRAEGERVGVPTTPGPEPPVGARLLISRALGTLALVGVHRTAIRSVSCATLGANHQASRLRK